VQAWIIMHEEDLMANWQLATTEQNIFRIEPLKQIHMNPRVTNVEPVQDGILDMKPYLEKGIFRELKDVSMFHSVRPFLGTINTVQKIHFFNTLT